MNFRYLKPKETECRIGRVINTPNFKGVMLLIYKNARVDMDILDETVGAENWQREHYECKGNLFCKVSININHNKPDKEPHFIGKADCGSESNTEKEKGESSDSFKRACVNWGIGRELYTAPTILVSDCNIDEKGKCNDKFYVREMTVEDGKITHLVIYNGAKNIKQNVFEYPKPQNYERPNAQSYEYQIQR